MKKNIIALALVCASFTAFAQSVDWTYQNQTFSAGDTVQVPFTVSGFSDIGAFQFTMKWDTATLALLAPAPFSVTGSLPGYGLGCFSWFGKPGYNLLPGEIRTLWTSATGKTLPAGTHVFSAWFIAKKAGSVCPALILWSKAPLWPLAYKSNLSYIPLSLTCTTPASQAQWEATIMDRAEWITDTVVSNMAIYPNPIIDSAHIEITSQEGPVLFNVLDAEGFNIFGAMYMHQGGAGTYDIPIAGSGIFFITAQLPDGSRQIEKVLKI